ncbi:hypothetical protein YPPY03_1485, partial [Yersinia pestis PY-03]
MIFNGFLHILEFDA